MPEPLVPPEITLRGLPWMRLDTARLLDSDLFALSTGDEFKAAVALWCKAWSQLPAGSLPDDDRLLAHLSGAGAKWKRVKQMALRGWSKADDGRLYHPVVAEQVLEAWEERQEFRKKLEAQNTRQREHREARAAMMSDLKAAGVHLAWNTPSPEVRAAHKKLSETGNDQPKHQSQTRHSDRRVESQTCSSGSHGLDGTGRDGKSKSSSSNTARTDPSEGSAPNLARALQGAGFPECAPTFPGLAEAQAEGVTPTELAALALQFAGKPLAYVIQAARGKRADMRQRVNGNGAAPAAAAVDPKIRAEAEARHELDDVEHKAANDCRMGLIEPEERDRRIAEARQAFHARFPSQEAACT